MSFTAVDFFLDSPMLIRSEIFGPVLPIVPVKDIDEALEIINSKCVVVAVAFAKSPFKIDQPRKGQAAIRESVKAFGMV